MTIKIKADLELVTCDDPEISSCEHCVFGSDENLCEQINKTHPCKFDSHYVFVNANIKERK